MLVTDAYHLNTNELILTSQVRGNPTPEVTWFKDAVELEDDDKYEIIDHPDGTCELIVDKPAKKDSGKYLIKAENRAGKAEIRHTVLFEGASLHIHENIHGVFHADKNVLKKEKDKKKEDPAGEPAAPVEEEEQKPKKDGYESSDYSDTETAPGSGIKRKRKRERKIGIYFKAKLSDRVVAEGSKVKFTCCVEGNDPAVRWYLDEKPVVFSPTTKVGFIAGLCTLELINVTEAQSGTYKCHAKDNNGEVASTCKLTVYKATDADVPPTFTRTIKDTYNSKMNELILDVNVRGLPTPSITWIKDGVIVESSERYQQIYHEDGSCNLIVANPTIADSGKYICWAENTAGKVEVAHVVQFEPIPGTGSPSRGSPLREGKPPTGEETEEQKAERERRKKNLEDEEYSGRGREVPPPPDLKKRIYITNSLVNRIVKVGANCKWTVCVDGPDPIAKWYFSKEGVEEKTINFSSHTKIQMQDGLAILIINGVTEEDAGTYRLVVKGSDNECEVSGTLTVYSLDKESQKVAPVFTVPIKGKCTDCNLLCLMFLYSEGVSRSSKCSS